MVEGNGYRGADLRGADFYRAYLEGEDFSGADLTGACLVKAELDEAVLRGARLDGAELTAASLYAVDASGASFRGALILGAGLLETDLRGADLSGAVLHENSFKVLVDGATVLDGLTGTVFGPVTLVREDGQVELGGAELERWIAARGGRVQVIPPKRPMAGRPASVAAAAMAARLRAVDWRDQRRAVAEAETRAVLVKEYLRRAALWVEWSGVAVGDWPFLDLVELVDPTVEVPEEVRVPFEEYLSDTVGLPSACAVSRAAVRWAAMTELSAVPRPPLEDPYEPLVRCFELGGGLATEGHWIDLWTVMIPRRRPADWAAPDPVTRLLDRLAAVRWHDEDLRVRHEGSRAGLFAEYLRRMGSWAVANGVGRPWPAVDPVQHLDPAVRLDAAHEARLAELTEDRALGPLVARLCRNAARWAELGRWRAVGVAEDPFEPLLLFFERGGQFFREGGIALIGNGGVPIRTAAEWAGQPPIGSLASADLDAMDRC
ncbi:pentapeptide repeat-containing protein [Kitasatospora sp. NPDC096147]|uniref:pentapeptide repeat-containing protein n=1 Tax=Kitasatospora sp. NPDC096147 TaxID=3364093 RepID=UPI003830AF40